MTLCLVPNDVLAAARGIIDDIGASVQERRCHSCLPRSLREEPVSDSILQRVAAGDAAAVNECIDRYSGLVWSLARQFTRNAGDVEDAVQEIFINVWKSADRFDPGIASEATYIAMIARRRLIDRTRAAGRRPKPTSLSEGDDFSDTIPSDVGLPENPGTLDEETSRAYEALSQLREEQQQVLNLAIGHSRTYQQIADLTGMPLSTVKTHARRGLMRVREIIAEQEAQSQSAGAAS